MLEMLINPMKAERRPWELFFVGAFYASLSILLVNWIFAQDAVLSRYSGILVVTFTVMFSMPFVYYTIRLEEKRFLNACAFILIFSFLFMSGASNVFYGVTYFWYFFSFLAIVHKFNALSLQKRDLLKADNAA